MVGDLRANIYDPEQQPAKNSRMQWLCKAVGSDYIKAHTFHMLQPLAQHVCKPHKWMS
jgi:hypothetical protein